MLTKKSIRFFGAFLRICSFGHGIPYEWDSSKGQIKVNISPKRLLMFRIAYFSNIAAIIYILGVLYLELKKPKREIEDLIWIIIWILAPSWALILRMNAYNKRTETSSFFNKMLSLDQHFLRKRHKGSGDPEDKSTLVEKVILTMGACAIGYNVSVTLLFIYDPELPHYWYSLVPEKYRQLPTLIIFILLEIYSKGTNGCSVGFNFQFVVIYMVFSTYWANVIRTDEAPLQEKIKDYRKLALLNNYYAVSVSRSVIPCHLLSFAGFFTVCLFATIRFHGVMSWVSFGTFPLIVNNMVVMGGLQLLSAAKVHKSSLACVKLFKHAAIDKNLRRQVKGLHPFGIQIGVGVWQIVEHFTILVYFLSLSNYITSLLVAFPSSASSY